MRNEKNQTHSRIFDSRNTHKKKCRRKEKKKNCAHRLTHRVDSANRCCVSLSFSLNEATSARALALICWFPSTWDCFNLSISAFNSGEKLKRLLWISGEDSPSHGRFTPSSTTLRHSISLEREKGGGRGGWKVPRPSLRTVVGHFGASRALPSCISNNSTKEKTSVKQVTKKE